jgi:hypothetical protein
MILSEINQATLSKTYFETSGAKEETFRALRMIEAAVADRHSRRANSQTAHVVLST